MTLQKTSNLLPLAHLADSSSLLKNKLGESKYEPLQSFYSVIRTSKTEDKGVREKGSERRTHRRVGSNLFVRNCQFEWAAWG